MGCATSALHSYGITPDAENRIYIASTACSPPVLSKTFCRSRNASGKPVNASGVTLTSSRAGE